MNQSSKTIYPSEMEERLLAYIDILGFSSAILNGSEDVKNNATFLIQKLYHFDQNRECLIQNQSIQDGSVYGDVANLTF